MEQEQKDEFIENDVNREIEEKSDEMLREWQEQQNSYTPSKHTEEELDEIAPDIF